MLLAWGTDLLWTGDAWSNARAKNHARGTHVRDPFQLRVNAYRVLLTRGRDGAVPALRRLLRRSRPAALKPQSVKRKRLPERLAAGIDHLIAAIPQEVAAVPADVGIALEQRPEPQIVTVP